MKVNTKSTKKFVLVYEDKSILRSHFYRTTFKQRAAAERLAKRLMQQQYPKLVVMEYSVYVAYGYDKLFRKVRNVMTGEMVEENINTPYSCSVASEAYWSN